MSHIFSIKTIWQSFVCALVATCCDKSANKPEVHTAIMGCLCGIHVSFPGSNLTTITLLMCLKSQPYWHQPHPHTSSIKIKSSAIGYTLRLFKTCWRHQVQSLIAWCSYPSFSLAHPSLSSFGPEVLSLSYHWQEILHPLVGLSRLHIWSVSII